MAITNSGSDIILNNTAPATVTTADLFAAVRAGGSNLNDFGHNVYVGGSGTGRMIIQNGAHLILDSRIGIFSGPNIEVQNGGTLTIGPVQADYEETIGGNTITTGDPFQDNGVSAMLYGTNADALTTAAIGVAQGGTFNWNGRLGWEGYLFFAAGSTINIQGGASGLGANTNIGQETTPAQTETRIRANSPLNIDGGPFLIRGAARADLIVNPAFTNGGSYGVSFTARGAFQSLSAAAQGFAPAANDTPADFPDIPNVGLINDFVGDAWGGKAMSLRNIATADKNYIITHNARGSNDPATLIYARADFTFNDSDGNEIDTRVWARDEGTANRGTSGQPGFSSALPNVISYNGNPDYWLTSRTTPAFGTDVHTGLNRNVLYEWRTMTDGPNDIITRVISRGASSGGNYTSTANGQVPSTNVPFTHYRFTTDNRDTVAFHAAAYGYLAGLQTFATAGHATSNAVTTVLQDDPVVVAAGRDRNNASSFYENGAIGSTDDIINVIAFAYQASAENMRDVEAVVGSHRTPWNGFDANMRVDLTDWNITLNSAAVVNNRAVVFSTGNNTIVINGVDSTLTQGNVGITIGGNTLSLNGVTVPDAVNFIHSGSPGAGDVIFEIPQAWRDLAGAYYAVWDSTDIAFHGLTSAAPTLVVARNVGAGNTARIALVHPAYNDVIASTVASSLGVVTITPVAPSINPLFSTDANTVYDGSDTAASYFGIYDGTPTVTPNVAADPGVTGERMAVESLIDFSGTARRLNGSRANNVFHNFKGNAFGARYAAVAARHGLSPVSATATTGVTSNNLIDFAYAQPALIENGAVVIEGIEGSVQTLQSTRRGYDSPTVDYDIVEGRVISGSGTSLDNRNLTTDNVGNLGLLKPARDAAGNILQGN